MFRSFHQRILKKDLNSEIEMKRRKNALKRKLQVEQGAYDGRFITKVVKDKRKERSKTICRTKIDKDED